MEIGEAIKQKKFNNVYHKAIVNVLYTAGWLNARHAKLIKPYGISVQQYNALRILRGQHPNPASVGLIQDRMLDPMSNASRLIDKLHEKKLVDRKTCKTDRRQVDILITDAGLRLLAELDIKMKELEKDMGALRKEEAEALSQMLDKIRS